MDLRESQPIKARKLKKTCDLCARQKVRCDGGKSCWNCASRSLECVFSERRRRCPSIAPKKPRRAEDVYPSEGNSREVAQESDHSRSLPIDELIDIFNRGDNPPTQEPLSRCSSPFKPLQKSPNRATEPCTTSHSSTHSQLSRVSSLPRVRPTQGLLETEWRYVQMFLEVINCAVPYTDHIEVSQASVVLSTDHHDLVRTALRCIWWSAAALGAGLVDDSKATTYASYASQALDSVRRCTPLLVLARAHMISAAFKQRFATLSSNAQSLPVHSHHAVAESILDNLQASAAVPSNSVEFVTIKACLVHERVQLLLAGSYVEARVERLLFPSELRLSLLPFHLQVLYHVDSWLLHLYRRCMNAQHPSLLVDSNPEYEEEYHRNFLLKIKKQNCGSYHLVAVLSVTWFIACCCFEHDKLEEGLQHLRIIANLIIERSPFKNNRYLWHMVHGVMLVLFFVGEDKLASQLETLLNLSAEAFVVAGDSCRTVDLFAFAHPLTEWFYDIVVGCLRRSDQLGQLSGGSDTFMLNPALLHNPHSQHETPSTFEVFPSQQQGVSNVKHLPPHVFFQRRELHPTTTRELTSLLEGLDLTFAPIDASLLPGEEDTVIQSLNETVGKKVK